MDSVPWIARRVNSPRALSGALLQCVRVFFEIWSRIENAETFAVGTGIRELPRLRRLYGVGRWRKRKGTAAVKLADGTIRVAEIHWYEASGIGKREFKI